MFPSIYRAVLCWIITATVSHAASFVSTGEKNGRCRGRELFKVTLPLEQCAAKCVETPSCRYFGHWTPGDNNAGRNGCRGWDGCEGSLIPLYAGYFNYIYRMTHPSRTTTTTATIRGTTTTSPGCKWMLVWSQYHDP